MKRFRDFGSAIKRSRSFDKVSWRVGMTGILAKQD
jgi:hypothetical protein